MELHEALKMGNKLAEYFVYYCGEGEHYVPLVERLREANTRSTLLEAVYILLRYGHLHLIQNMKKINQKIVDDLFLFIRTGNIKQVSRFHSSLIANISTFELEKIRNQERYLIEMLT